MNKEIIETIKATKTIDEFKEVAAKYGYNLNNEEAKGYFDLYHTSGKITDDELNSVAGGACRNGRQYSTDKPYRLIVTAGNCCDLFVEDPDEAGFGKNCYHCKNCYKGGLFGVMTLYCEVRTFNDDPYNR